MADANTIVWTTDWHLVATDSEQGGLGWTTPTRAQQVVSHIVSTYDPIGCIDTGDNKDIMGGGTQGAAYDNYINLVQQGLPWLTVNAGDTNALYPNLPGNHDEATDYTVPGPANDFSTTFDPNFWGEPYHWTADWHAPRIRFIAFHSYIYHTTAYPNFAGFGVCPDTERAWLENELATLPERWQAIVCSHFPVPDVFGNNIHSSTGGTALRAVLAAYDDKIVACFSGHRHFNYNTALLNNILHITTGGVSYGLGNGRGTFSPITYNPANRTITLDCRLARVDSGYARFPGFTPLTLQLQPHRLFFART